MLTLITGVPGCGKSAGAVDLIIREYADRPLYVDGLNGLKLDHFEIDVLNWQNEAPDGALVVVDEVQRKWRPRGPGSKVPDSVAALETHRHRGIDFIIITQNPRLVDVNVRTLIGRHIHIRDTGWAGRWWYEWPECSESLSWRNCENKRRYKLPKRVFDLYTSASMHTKPVRKVPIMLFLAIAAIVVSIVLLFWLYRSINKKEPTSAGVETLSVPSGPIVSDSVSAPEVSKSVYNYADFIPRISHRPESAPAYDHLRVVTAMPLVTGGMCIDEKCTCFNQQGTNAGLTDDECRSWMRRRPFNAYHESNQDSPGSSRSQLSPVQQPDS